MFHHHRYACALSLAATLLAPAAFADGTITWNWNARQQLSGATVAQDSGSLLTTPSVGSITLDEPRAFVAGVGQLNTSFEFQVDGHIDSATRSVGVGVEIVAEETPWDERSPPRIPSRRLGTARVHAELRDLINVQSLSEMAAALGGNSFVDANIRPSKFDGTLKTPIIIPGAGGSLSRIDLDLMISDIVDTGPPVELLHIPFTKHLTSETSNLFHISTASGDGDPLGSTHVPLPNGHSILIVITMDAIVQLSGDPFPAADPARVQASAEFNNTFSFGGFFDFKGAQGNLLDDVTITSASGIDWTSPLPVPLPGSLAMLVAGLPLLLAKVRRRSN